MGTIGRFDTDAAALSKRIAAHDRYGKNDLNAWCFEQMRLAPGQSVLDLGAGTGKQAVAMAERGCAVTAVDASPGALEALRDGTAARGLDATTINCDFDSVPDRVTGAFDRVISAYAIYYTKEPIRLFRFIHQSLRSDGALFFCGPAFDNNREMKSFLISIGHSFTPGAASFMEETGPQIARSLFRHVTLSKFENPVVFDAPEAMWDYWSSHNMYDAALAERFRQAAEVHFRNHGTFTMTKSVRGVLALR